MHAHTRTTYITQKACAIIAITPEEEIHMQPIVNMLIGKIMLKDFVKIVISNQRIKGREGT
jgi:hypothetical protein